MDQEKHFSLYDLACKTSEPVLSRTKAPRSYPDYAGIDEELRNISTMLASITLSLGAIAEELIEMNNKSTR